MGKSKQRQERRSLFVGDRHRPLLPQELAEQRPILSNGTPPEELLALGRRQTVFITGEGDQPNVSIATLQGFSEYAHQPGWRIDVTLHGEQQFTVFPGLNAVRSAPEFYRKSVSDEVTFQGYRPKWMDMFYLPRTVSWTGHKLMHRLNGRATRPLWVFGDYAPRLFRDASYPWGCVGLISNSAGATGTGVLVGRNIVATAGHMVPWNSGTDAWIRFVPADYIGMGSQFGKSVQSLAVEARGYDTDDSVTGYDWAILKLDQPLGDLVGFMGYNSYTDDWEDVNCWTIVGYPGGAGPFWQGGISVNDDDEDSAGGQELETENGDTLEAILEARCLRGGVVIRA